MQIEHCGTVKDLETRDDLELVCFDVDVAAIKDHFGNTDDINEFQSFFVAVKDGEYQDVYGCYRAVPWNWVDVYHITK